MRKLVVAVAVALLLSSCTPALAETYADWVWGVVDIEGKPSDPPTLLAAPDDWMCGEVKAAGCYYPASHEYWVHLECWCARMLINHELAHALIRGTPGHGAEYLDAYKAVKEVSAQIHERR